MSELTDDVLTGRMCSTCGIMFVKSHGYPVLCKYCYMLDKLARRQTPTATPELPLAMYVEV